MNKLFFICITIIILLISCSSFGSSNIMLNSVNALGYSNIQANIDYGKKIWYGPIKITSEILDIEYLASWDINNINSLSIYIPINLNNDTEYNIEIATIFSYFAELYRQIQSNEEISINKAILHMKNSYKKMIENYLINNNHDYKNPRNFSELIMSSESFDVFESKYYFNGKAIFENDIIIKYEK